MKIKSVSGNGMEYEIRRDVNNKRLWVVDIYFENRPYPNIISGTYKNLKTLREAISEYQTSGKIPWGGWTQE